MKNQSNPVVTSMGNLQLLVVGLREMGVSETHIQEVVKERMEVILKKWWMGGGKPHPSFLSNHQLEFKTNGGHQPLTQAH